MDYRERFRNKGRVNMNTKDLVSGKKINEFECNSLSQANKTTEKSKLEGLGNKKILNEESSLEKKWTRRVPRVVVNNNCVSGTATRSSAIAYLAKEKMDYHQRQLKGGSLVQFPRCKQHLSAKPAIAKMAEPELSCRNSKAAPKTTRTETNKFISQGSICADIETWRSKNAARISIEKTQWIVKSQTQAELAVCEYLLKEHDYFKKNIDRYEKDKQMYEKKVRERIAKHWNESIFRPLNRLLNRERKEGALEKELNKKRELFEKYLEYVNRKDRRGVFLNTVSLAEYDPGSTSVHVNLMVKKQSEFL